MNSEPTEIQIKNSRNIGIAMMLVGAFTTIFFYNQFSLGVSSNSWPYNEGEIINSEVKTHKGKKGRTSEHVQITYQYSIDEVHFTSKNYSHRLTELFNALFLSNSYVLENFKNGEFVNVYYNPKNPK